MVNGNDSFLNVSEYSEQDTDPGACYVEEKKVITGLSATPHPRRTIIGMVRILA